MRLLFRYHSIAYYFSLDSLSRNRSCQKSGKKHVAAGFGASGRISYAAPENIDPEISEQTISGEMTDVYLMLGEGEKSVELLKKHNAGGLSNDMIGLTLAANCKRPEEAMPFLSEALDQSVVSLIRTVSRY